MAEQYRLARLPGFLDAALAVLRGQLDPGGQREVLLDRLAVHVVRRRVAGVILRRPGAVTRMVRAMTVAGVLGRLAGLCRYVLAAL